MWRLTGMDHLMIIKMFAPGENLVTKFALVRWDAGMFNLIIEWKSIYQQIKCVVLRFNVEMWLLSLKLLRKYEKKTLPDDSSNVPFAKMFYCSTRICVVIDRCAVFKEKSYWNKMFNSFNCIYHQSKTNLISMVVQMICIKIKEKLVSIRWQSYL